MSNLPPPRPGAFVETPIILTEGQMSHLISHSNEILRGGFTNPEFRHEMEDLYFKLTGFPHETVLYGKPGDGKSTQPTKPLRCAHCGNTNCNGKCE
jgi:hypothetical protein